MKAGSGSRNSFALAWRIARRELRGGLHTRFRGFRIFLACLALGAGAIAAVGSVSSSVEAGLAANARLLLGGDVEIRINHIALNQSQRAWLNSNGTVSEVVELRAMARRTDDSQRRLVELKAVDDAYPLVGTVILDEGQSWGTALKPVAGNPAAIVDPSLLRRLDIKVGDDLSIGNATFRITAALIREPDQATRGIQLGPPVIISRAGLDASGLVQPGSLSEFHYRIVLPPGVGAPAFIKRLADRFPDATWRIRDAGNATPGLQRFIDRLTLFLSLVGLSALLIGGVGVGNAVYAFLQQRAATIATLKCLGASVRLVQQVYLMQILVLSGIGIGIGLIVGAAAPLVAAAPLASVLPVPPEIGIYPAPLALAAAFGVLITLVFSIWPLTLAGRVPAAALFRQAISPLKGRRGFPDLVRLGVPVAALVLLTILTARDTRLAVWFVIGATCAFIAFDIAADVVMRIARAWPRPRHPRLRMAITNLYRPGAPTPSVVMSLGLGITVLVAIMLTERNLDSQIDALVEEQAPAFYFIDIQPDQANEFEAVASAVDGVTAVRRVPMLRGRITAMKEIPASELAPPPNFAWVVRGDRGLTWSRTPPERGSRIVEGEWWPADYDGEPLISFDADAAEAFGIGIGDTVDFNILGRAFTARVANLRQIDWATLGMNFVVIFSPGALERAPQVSIATVHVDAAHEDELEAVIVDRFPNVSAIRVREVLADINGVLSSINVAMKAIAALAIVAGVLVLAGAIVAGRRQRIYDAVVLKTLGATRRDILFAYLLEFIFLGIITAAIAAIAGSLAAWGISVGLLHIEWAIDGTAIVWTTSLCVVATMVFGLVSTWRALGQKAAPLLRTE